jgi:hypothetical protein
VNSTKSRMTNILEDVKAAIAQSCNDEK